MELSDSAGKNDSAATIMITANVIPANVNVSVFNVPALSGMDFFSASNPAMATGHIIGRNLPSSRTIPHEISQNKVLSPNPSKPEPLVADEDVNL